MNAAIMVLASTIPAYGQDLSEGENVERVGLEFLERSESQGIVKPHDVEAMANRIFEKPVTDQTDDDLKNLARHANTAATSVGYILNGYLDYCQGGCDDAYMFRNAYRELHYRLQFYRNKALFSLGRKAMERGDEVEAMIYFRESYRLSPFERIFVWHAGKENIRYKSEILMKKILGIEEYGTLGTDRYRESFLPKRQ